MVVKGQYSAIGGSLLGGKSADFQYLPADFQQYLGVVFSYRIINSNQCFDSFLCARVWVAFGVRSLFRPWQRNKFRTPTSCKGTLTRYQTAGFGNFASLIPETE
jgi:hypothetical protein